ncbi:hypothetical protein WICMUC_002585 [Wickerhamomyces mucosus]|uniref:Uncharacterized protein n=1 Tax=Wickerhamomyces mucosus TaxID=1378264 RepID=A0A9P8PP21_9ASCO|nr:hypothetical protein WICMUC_002585 [Wickerhamomyces mucosus]
MTYSVSEPIVTSSRAVAAEVESTPLAARYDNELPKHDDQVPEPAEPPRLEVEVEVAEADDSVEEDDFVVEEEVEVEVEVDELVVKVVVDEVSLVELLSITCAALTKEAVCTDCDVVEVVLAEFVIN